MIKSLQRGTPHFFSFEKPKMVQNKGTLICIQDYKRKERHNIETGQRVYKIKGTQEWVFAKLSKILRLKIKIIN